MNGRIFSIEEFSTFDGPGIRCSVFFKGCPLRCMWCHNPEGQRFEAEYLRAPNGCIGCGSCMASGALCEESVLACPQHLIRRCGNDYTPDALVQLLSAKLPMLNAAGGGVTFSGGEPLAQPEFLIECLEALAGKTHRAIQTCGYASEQVFRDALSRCEYMLYDLKLMDPQLHRRYTGVDNARILQNYRILAQSGLDFITRIPLIPGVNDTAGNLTATAEFMAQLGVRRIELLPYNQAAGAKYRSLGRTYQTDFDPAARVQTHEEIFRNFSIEVNVL